MALLHRLELPVEGLGFFEPGLQLDALVGAAFPAGERRLAPERLEGVAQVAGAQLGHAVRVEPVVVTEQRRTRTARLPWLLAMCQTIGRFL